MPLADALVVDDEQYFTGAIRSIGSLAYAASSLPLGRDRDAKGDDLFNSPLLLYRLPVPPGARIAHAALRLKPASSHTFDVDSMKVSLIKRDGKWDGRAAYTEYLEAQARYTGESTAIPSAGYYWQHNAVFSGQGGPMQWFAGRPDNAAVWMPGVARSSADHTPARPFNRVTFFPAYRESDGTPATVNPPAAVAFQLDVYKLDNPSDVEADDILDKPRTHLGTQVISVRDTGYARNTGFEATQWGSDPDAEIGDAYLMRIQLLRKDLIPDNHIVELNGRIYQYNVDASTQNVSTDADMNLVLESLGPAGRLRRPQYFNDSVLPGPTSYNAETDVKSNIWASTAPITPIPFVADTEQIWGDTSYSPDIEVDIAGLLQQWVDDPSYQKDDYVLLALHVQNPNIAAVAQLVDLYAAGDSIEPGIELLVCYEPWKASDADPASPWATADADPASPWATADADPASPWATADADPASPWAASDADPSTPWTKTDVEDC